METLHEIIGGGMIACRVVKFDAILLRQILEEGGGELRSSVRSDFVGPAKARYPAPEKGISHRFGRDPLQGTHFRPAGEAINYGQAILEGTRRWKWTDYIHMHV